MFCDVTDESVASMLIAPAVTSWTDGEERPTNPAVRRVTYDRYQLHLVEVEQYWLDLNAAIVNKVIRIMSRS